MSTQGCPSYIGVQPPGVQVTHCLRQVALELENLFVYNWCREGVPSVLVAEDALTQ